MEHYQKKFVCTICKRVLIADIFSYGTIHQEIKAITCEQCGIAVGGTFLGDKVETI